MNLNRGCRAWIVVLWGVSAAVLDASSERLSSPGPTSPRYSCSDCVFPIPRRVKPVYLRLKHGLKRRGVNLENLRPLINAPSLNLQTDMFSSLQKCSNNILTMALLNARSIVNKTFLINDFILFRWLDFLFVTETWLNVDEIDPLFEMAPESFNFEYSQRKG